MESADGYVLYDDATGEIRMQVGSLSTALENKRPGEKIFNGRWHDGLWQIVNGAPVPRPKLFAQDVYRLPADGMTELSILGIPPKTMIKVNREAWTVIDDGAFEFVTAFAGEWVIEVLPPFPFQSQTVRISCHAH